MKKLLWPISLFRMTTFSDVTPKIHTYTLYICALVAYFRNVCVSIS